MDVVKWLAFAAVAFYAVIVAAMYVGQRGLVFPLRPQRSAPAEAGFPKRKSISSRPPTASISSPGFGAPPTRAARSS